MRLPSYQSSSGSAMPAPSTAAWSLSLRIVSALGASMLLLGLIVQLSTLQHALHQEFRATAAAGTTRMDAVDAMIQQTEVADPLQSAVFRQILDALSPSSTSFGDTKDDQVYVAIAFGSQNVVSGDYVPMDIVSSGYCYRII